MDVEALRKLYMADFDELLASPLARRMFGADRVKRVIVLRAYIENAPTAVIAELQELQ